MLILLTVIFIIASVILLGFLSEHEGALWFGIMTVVFSVAFAASMLFVGGGLIYGQTIQEKISLYEAENAEIDSQICEIVEGYKTYEKETFENISNKSANVLVELYPDLKTNELVQKQMEIYMSNKKKVVSLQEDLINQKPLRWWLYFGG